MEDLRTIIDKVFQVTDSDIYLFLEYIHRFFPQGNIGGL